MSQHECFTKSNVNPQDTWINCYIRWSALAKQFQVKYKKHWNIIKSNPLLKGASSFFLFVYVVLGDMTVISQKQQFSVINNNIVECTISSQTLFIYFVIETQHSDT